MFPPSLSMTLPPFTSRELDCIIMEAFMVSAIWLVYYTLHSLKSVICLVYYLTGLNGLNN